MAETFYLVAMDADGAFAVLEGGLEGNGRANLDKRVAAYDVSHGKGNCVVREQGELDWSKHADNPLD